MDKTKIGEHEIPMVNNLEEVSCFIEQSDGHTIHPDRPFTGQPHTDQGERGKTEVKGIRFRDLADSVAKALILSTPPKDENYEDQDYVYLQNGVETNTLSYNDLYKLDLSHVDPVAIIQNVACEVEKAMGIFPNVPKLKTRE